MDKFTGIMTCLGLIFCIACLCIVPVNHDYNNANIEAICPAYRIIDNSGVLSCRDI